MTQLTFGTHIMTGTSTNTTTQTYVGIDLGTTRCVMASQTGDASPTIIQLESQQNALPSLIYFPEDAPPLCGQEASSLLLAHPERGGLLFKRKMGQPQWYLQIDTTKYTAKALSTLLLHHLHSIWCEHHPQAEAVITVPAYFDDIARRETIEAARDAGWQVLGLLNEPSAAALAYHAIYPPKDTAPQCGLVFDLGGGTLDVTVLRQSSDKIEMLSSTGDTKLGGQEWDDAIAWKLSSQCAREYEWDPLDEPKAFEHLRRQCQQLREHLTNKHTETLFFAYEGIQLELTITREELERWCRPFVERSIAIAQRALDEAQLSISQLDHIILAGGGSRMPMIREALQAWSDLPLESRLDPERSIAVGAAIRAQQLAQLPQTQRRSDADAYLPGAQLSEISAHPLGFLIMKDGTPHNKILFPKHTPLPAKYKKSGFTTSHNNQTEIDIHLMQSDAPTPKAETCLASFRIHDIPPNPQIELTFRYGLNALIEVEAVELETTQTLLVTPITSPSLETLITPTPKDIVFAIDCSASMKGKAILEAKLAAYEFLNNIRPEGMRFGLVSFGDPGVHVRTQLQPQPIVIRAHLAELQAVGTTPLGAAIHASIDLFGTTQREKHLMIITDGTPDNKAEAENAASLAHKQGINIKVIAIGQALDRPFLEHRICQTTADCHAVNDPIDLSQVFTSLASELSKRTGALTKWPPKNGSNTL
ncbi:MAG TPA: hypothetical protein DCE42_27490 [Myxococcales bacterium]|nr:hypothetical protein [Myxococcales bacterium]